MALHIFTFDILKMKSEHLVGRSSLLNKHIKMISFKNCKNIHKKEGGPDRSVSDNQFSSLTRNKLATKPENHTVISSFSNKVIQ